MKLIVTIDTEEDAWGNYDAEVFSTENICRLPALAEIFAKHSVRPTYLISYPVATRDDSLGVMQELVKADSCEVGMHCHPWNTPPLLEDLSKTNSMLCNLPEDLQYRKLQALDLAIQKNLNVKARSFRAGRWAFDHTVARTLMRLGYIVDSSVTPFVSWRKMGGRDYTKEAPVPYWMDDPLLPGKRLLELPATVDFVQSNNALAGRAYKILSHDRFKRLRLKGILDRLHLLNRIWLSPELNSLKDMIELTGVLVRRRPEVQFINFTFHSPSLQAGLTPFVRSKTDEKRFLRTIDGYLRFVRSLGIESIRLQDSVKLMPAPEAAWNVRHGARRHERLYGAIGNG